MKIFIAYKFSNNGTKDELKNILTGFDKIMAEKGHATFINWRDKQNWQDAKESTKEIIEGALEELRKCDALFAFVNVPEKSDGLLIETGFAKALGKKIILGIQRDLKYKFLKDISDIVIEFNDLGDLKEKLKKIL